MTRPLLPVRDDPLREGRHHHTLRRAQGLLQIHDYPRAAVLIDELARQGRAGFHPDRDRATVILRGLSHADEPLLPVPEEIVAQIRHATPID